MKIHVGTSGWSYPGWRSRFYPPEIKPPDWLEYYAGHFDTVEINMTFYRSPRPETLHGWAERTPADFLFTLKANRQITHLKKLQKVEHDLEHLAFLARQLRGKIGCLLYQLPPSLSKDLELLGSFLKMLPMGFRQVIEFRHPSWYDPAVYELMSASGAIFCVVSSSRVPPEAVVTAPVAYFRFHGLTGGYRYRYSDEELKKWAETISQCGAAEAFIYFNNDYQAHAVSNARKLRELLSGH
ncbi:MAG: DUF72 domain-containing protein [Candidatus Aminicenantes bacterium]|nr:DUF72 domain-containing protein [Candidatus Aminicenantes bacterium]